MPAVHSGERRVRGGGGGRGWERAASRCHDPRWLKRGAHVPPVRPGLWRDAHDDAGTRRRAKRAARQGNKGKKVVVVVEV